VRGTPARLRDPCEFFACPDRISFTGIERAIGLARTIPELHEIRAMLRNPIRIAFIGIVVQWLAAVCVGAEPRVSDGFVTVADGARIHYLESGTADAVPALLFIPGWTMDADIWRRQIAEFSTSRRVIAIDPRSQGKSTRTPEGNTPEMRARDLRQVIQSLKLDSVVLVGWSQGVQDLAAYVGTFDTNGIAGFVLVDSPVAAGPAAVQLRPVETQQLLGRFAVYAASPREYLAGMMRVMFSKPVSADELRRRIDMAAEIPTSIGTTMLVADLLMVDRRPALAKFDKKTLIIASSRSRELNEMKTMAGQIADAELVTIDDAAHAVFVDQPEQFNRAIAAFLDKFQDAAQVAPR
jgi:non-heme chloroperoxidase